MPNIPDFVTCTGFKAPRHRPELVDAIADALATALCLCEADAERDAVRAARDFVANALFPFDDDNPDCPRNADFRNVVEGRAFA